MSGKSLSFDTIVVGGGQAGLSTGYFLKKQGRDFAILDASPRVGDAWRQRWDSLRLFTPARFCGLAGMRFPAHGDYFPTKDEMADYLESYAAHFDLPVQTGVRVDRLWRGGAGFHLSANGRQYEAENVIVAMASYQKPSVPDFAQELDAGITQLHSSAYRNLSQLRPGGVLVVGVGNSGAEIALEASRSHPTWLSGPDVGHIPFRIESPAARLILVRLVLRGIFHRLLTVNTPVGRKMRPKMLSHGAPLVRTKPKDLAAAGIVRVPRTTGVRGGRPVLEDGQVMDVANVIWCTGFRPGFSWIDLPIFDGVQPRHHRGVAAGAPGLYFVGLNFLFAASSNQIHGVGRDAEYVVRTIEREAAKSGRQARAEGGRRKAGAAV